MNLAKKKPSVDEKIIRQSTEKSNEMLSNIINIRQVVILINYFINN